MNKNLAPNKVAIFPLMKKPELKEKTEEVFEMLSGKFTSSYSETGSIGKRYRKADEVGTPYCVTVDYDSLEDNTVTVRDRDTMEQQRVKIDDLAEFIQNGLDS